MNHGMKRSVFPALFLWAVFAPGGEEYRIPWDQLKDSAQRYLAACVRPETRTKMAKKFKNNVEQRVQDTGWDEDTAMRTLMLDWAAGNRGKLERKEPESVAQACFYFVAFLDKGYDVPGQIRESLTSKTVAEILDYLEKEVKTGAKRT